MGRHSRSAPSRHCRALALLALVALLACGGIEAPSAPECGGSVALDGVVSSASGVEPGSAAACPNGTTRRRLTPARQ